MTLSHRRSRRQEDRLAKDLGGRRMPASGAFWSRKGDVQSDVYKVEAKTTEKASISLKKEWVDKIHTEAVVEGRIPLLALEIQDMRLVVMVEEDWFILNREAGR